MSVGKISTKSYIENITLINQKLILQKKIFFWGHRVSWNCMYIYIHIHLCVWLFQEIH